VRDRLLVRERVKAAVADLVMRKALQEGHMTFTRPLQLTNRVVPIRPLVRLAAKLVGSGPNRLRMVKLSHELGEDGRHL
jgi:hypothetical protein